MSIGRLFYGVLGAAIVLVIPPSGAGAQVPDTGVPSVALPTPTALLRPWIRVIYGPPTNKRDNIYQSWVMKSSQLPRFVSWANRHFPAPAGTRELDVYVGHCMNPADNASFGHGNIIRICNNFVYDAINRYMNVEHLGVQAADRAAEGLIYFTFFHEFAHAIEADYNLPVLGNAESSADEFAALAIARHPTMYPDAIAAMNYFWDNRSASTVNSGPYEWDVHPMHVERISEMACFMYESDPAKFQVFVRNYGLTGESQSSCRQRYAMALWSWRTMLKSVNVIVANDQAQLFE